MKKFAYHLDKSSKKLTCPKCGLKRFTPYVDKDGTAVCATKYGRCDREHKCGYNLYPSYKDYEGYKIVEKEYIPKKRVDFPTKYIDYLKDFSNTNLYKFLCAKYDKAKVDEAFMFYGVKSYCYNTEVACFSYTNRNNNVRAIQLMHYDVTTGKRVKDTNYRWLHSSLIAEAAKRGKYPKDLIDYNNNESKIDCLFGEDMVELYPKAKIYIVESVKNAIVCFLEHGSPMISNKLFLAACASSMLQPYKLLAMKGRNVSIIPDKDSIDKWVDIMQKQNIVKYVKCDIKFKYLDDSGSDIADYYLSMIPNKVPATNEQGRA